MRRPGDTGPGIPAEKRELVFQAFAQADTSTARQHGGTGLGLRSSAKLLGLMGSKLLLDSTPAQGCTFHFEIGFASAQPAPGQKVPALLDWPRQRVLWIDPQPVTRQQVTATVTSNAATLVVRRVIPFEDAVFTSTGIGNSQRLPEAAGFPIDAIIVYGLAKTMPSRCQVSA